MSEIQTTDTTGTVAQYDSSSSSKMDATMQLHGIPYQFLDTTDQRVSGISKNLGRKYVENVIMDAPILTIIPGKPKYLPSADDKVSVTNAFLDASNGNFSSIRALLDTTDAADLKLYDFQSAFIDYYQYVNILCRTVAGFLELGSGTEYKINGKNVNFLKYDWKNYRWNGKNYQSTTSSLVSSIGGKIAKSIASIFKKKSTSDGVDYTDSMAAMDESYLKSCESALQRKNYIQFYVDPTSATMQYSVNSNTQESTVKQALDTASSATKELGFLMDTGGMDSESLQKLGDKVLTTIDSGLSSTVGGINAEAGSLISRLLTSGKAILRGDNIMMPNIWAGCDMSNQHTVTQHLKAPYGNKLALYMDVFVPMMHWVALAYPKATTANSYGSPFLVKGYMPGSWTTNLGIVTSLEITMDIGESALNVDGLYTEVDITATITDLYSDMALTPANDAQMFLNNSSLVDFLATTCGLNLIESQLATKAKTLWNNLTAQVTDTPRTVVGQVMEKSDALIAKFVGL